MYDLVLIKALEVAAGATMHTLYQEVMTQRGMLFKGLANATLFRDRKIRVSMAEILRIGDGHRYVLFQSIKRPERCTPIGGVVRCFSSGLRHLRETFGFIPEEGPGEEALDMRGFIAGNQFAGFLKWYYAGIGREKQALSREIGEEMRESGLRGVASKAKDLEFNILRVVH